MGYPTSSKTISLYVIINGSEKRGTLFYLKSIHSLFPLFFISRAPSDITLDAAKKQELLASLSALDDEEKSQIKPYQPSFLDSSRISTAGTRHESPSQLFNFEPVLDNPFNSASFKSLDSSINSVKSTVSVDSDKKAKLMRELFTTN